MPRLILQRDQFRDLIRRRRARGADRYDEVWNGVYVMSPEADNEHQALGLDFAITFKQALADVAGASVYMPVNVTDREDDWTKNYRVPDASVFLPGNTAIDRKSHWLGGPDFALEIASKGDRSRKKFQFYAAVNVRELLLLDRRPWRLELYARDGDQWNRVGISTPDDSVIVTSAVLPLTFRLLPGALRPRIEVTRPDDGRSWTI